MDASKEIEEIGEFVAIGAAIASFGTEWETVSAEDLHDRTRAIRYRMAEVMQYREEMRNRYS